MCEVSIPAVVKRMSDGSKRHGDLSGCDSLSSRVAPVGRRATGLGHPLVKWRATAAVSVNSTPGMAKLEHLHLCNRHRSIVKMELGRSGRVR